MESGLEGRNNADGQYQLALDALAVSMESGLEGRNNLGLQRAEVMGGRVSMESGLEGRNNPELDWEPSDMGPVSQWSPT